MKNKTLFLYVLFLLSWFWVLSLYLRHGLVPPADFQPLILQDLEFLGPYALILDVIVGFQDRIPIFVNGLSYG